MTDGETIRSFLERDHARLDQLLARAGRDPENIDMEAFGEFRRGLLKHIGMEEKILLPAIQRLRCGEPLAIAAKLRLDHGAIAALLVPTPRARSCERSRRCWRHTIESRRGLTVYTRSATV